MMQAKKGRGFSLWLTALMGLALAGVVYGQEVPATAADDSFEIPSIDTIAVAQPAAAVVAGPAFKTGLYLEVNSLNGFLTRDLATSQVDGYEYDNSSLSSKGNWWIWGKVTPDTLLDMTVGIWNASYPLYQVNSYASSLPKSTIADGLQGLSGIVFAPISGLNAGAEPGLDKLQVNFESPWIKAAVGYGKTKNSGKAGIFDIVDVLDDSGKGYLELRNGPSIATVEDVLKLDVLLGLSRAKASFGLYAWADATLFKDWGIMLSLASTSTSEELFRYDEANSNAFGVYLSGKPLKELNFKLQGLMNFGTGITVDLPAMAAAGQFNLDLGAYKLELGETIAGTQATSVWGDNTPLHIGQSVTWLKNSLDPLAWLNISLLDQLTFADITKWAEGQMSIYNQPAVKIKWMELFGFELDTGLYGSFNFTRNALVTDSGQSWTTNFEEAGIQVKTGVLGSAIAGIELDYAIVLNTNIWTWDATTKSFPVDKLYNSLVLKVDLNMGLSLSAAALIRNNLGAADPTFVPFGVAVGAKWANPFQIENGPTLWLNYTYDMYPYGAGDNVNLKMQSGVEYSHLSYRLQDLYLSTTVSQLNLGLIWNL